MRATQKTIARDLGISFMTVSRVFNNSGPVSEGLKKHILDYAQKVGYEPHRASQVLVRNTIRTIAVFSSTMPVYFWNDIKRGVLQAAESIKFFNYEVHYYQIPDFDTKKYCALLAKEIKNGLNAAAFVYQNIFDMSRIFAMIKKANIPYLLYNVDAADTGKVCYIGSDYGSGGRLAANFIGKALAIKPNGRALAIGFIRKELCGMTMTDINARRMRGFLSVMESRFPGVRCTAEYLDSEETADRQIMRLLKKYRAMTDAVYFIPAFNETYQRGLERYDYRGIITLQHDMSDLAVQYLEKDLLTAVVFQDPVLQGYTAVRRLETMLESKSRERLKDIEIAHTLVFRENINFLGNQYLMS